ncbi:cyclophilin-like protein [Rhizoclosmatium globosum]|uniref:peptidylprolyl isomerase n=1 Tax=Rhizoclosmatium globosum TaxID=329046 RepID=A0A1Y2CCQ7_9FUNG|nr:cyclophilin-like protein [Rhizoclosmatium globosum]|eukprot:ORY44829.1 cyclophilin-like protein [Rhizoclosmatium globosum]
MAVKLLILGSVKAPELQRVVRVCKKLEATQTGNLEINVEQVTPIEYLERLDALKQDIKDFIPSLFPGVTVRVLTGGKVNVLSAKKFIGWVKEKHQVDDVHGQDLGVEDSLVQEELEKQGQLAFETYIKGLKHTVVHMDVQVGSNFNGRLWFELYNDIVPRSTAHFVSLIQGTSPDPNGGDPLGYKGTLVNRIIKEGWFQAGEIFDATGAVVVNEYLSDENFIVPHNHRGSLSFVNKGPHSNFSQFMVTLRPMPYFDRKFVCIGRCLDGDDVLQAIDNVKTRYEKPTASIRVTKCELFCDGIIPPEKDRLPTFF